MRDVSEVAGERSWQWLRAGYLGKGTGIDLRTKYTPNLDSRSKIT